MQISLQPIFYLEERFQSFHEKPLSDFDIFNFKRRPNDLTRYENINIKSLEIYYFNQHYLSKEEKEKLVNQWPEFRSKINFIAKKKKHLNWSVSVHLIGKSHWLQKHFVFTWNNDKHIYLHYCEKKIFEVKYRENISLYKHE